MAAFNCSSVAARPTVAKSLPSSFTLVKPLTSPVEPSTFTRPISALPAWPSIDTFLPTFTIALVPSIATLLSPVPTCTEALSPSIVTLLSPVPTLIEVLIAISNATKF